MLNELNYPFDPALLLKKRRALKRELLSDGSTRLKKRIAVLGGSTTHDIIDMLELFLLHFGIQPIFYESEYGRFYEDALFSPELEAFQPELVFIHTSFRNLRCLPTAEDDASAVAEKLDREMSRFTEAWESIAARFACPVIQNNFEPPFYRLLGSRDGWDPRGWTCYAREMNRRFANYAASHESFYLNDLAYAAADYGLKAWSEPLYWHMYKYCMCLNAIPAFAWQLACIIKSIYGKNKKALVLDLDNTLWGGVVGDDGVEGIEIGQETSLGQTYAEFQRYLKALSAYGVLLAVNSKNDEDNALAGLKHPDGPLKPRDFVAIRANWEPKSRNFGEIATLLNILPESMVFVDDNPAERALVTRVYPEVSAPPLDTPEHYVTLLDRSGFFEATALSKDDLARVDMYRQNAARAEQQSRFTDYADYLRSLEMRAVIRPFEPMVLSRVTQLCNKSNQFNLTTRRCTESEIEAISRDPDYVTLYGRLSDVFGDNGLVSVVFGRQENVRLHIQLWLMSCRVLKRNMEHAMLDSLVQTALARGVETLVGYYYKTPKNGMVRNFYRDFGFRLSAENGEDTVWELDISDYQPKNHYIEVRYEQNEAL